MDRSRPTRRWRYMLLWTAFAVAIVFPFLAPNTYYIYVMTMAFVTVISATGLNVILGYAGQLNLAHAGFYAVGAYVVGISTVDYGVPYWLAFVLAAAFTGVLGLITGWISLRLKSHYFAIFTLCIGFIIYLLIEKSEFTHGTIGIIDIPSPGVFGPVSFEDSSPQYFLALGFMIAALWVMSRFVRSLWGRAFLAVRNSEELAEAIGINVMRTKVLALVISTTYAGVAGALYAGITRFLDPSMALITHTFQLVAYVLVGGIGTLYGPLVGVLLMTWLMQFVGPLEDYTMLLYGPMLILLVMLLPHGLMGLYSSRRSRSGAHA